VPTKERRQWVEENLDVHKRGGWWALRKYLRRVVEE